MEAKTPAPVTFKLAEPEDLPGIENFVRDALTATDRVLRFENPSARLPTDIRERVYGDVPGEVVLAIGDAGIVGFADYAPEDAITAEASIVVRGDHQNQGIGSALLGELVDHIRAQDMYQTLVAYHAGTNKLVARLFDSVLARTLDAKPVVTFLDGPAHHSGAVMRQYPLKESS